MIRECFHLEMLLAKSVGFDGFDSFESWGFNEFKRNIYWFFFFVDDFNESDSCADAKMLPTFDV